MAAWIGEKATWYFLSVPKDNGDQIKMFQPRRAGFGSVKVQVTIGSTTWQTSVFPSKKSDSFILPVKAAVRKAEKLSLEDEIEVRLLVKSQL